MRKLNNKGFTLVELLAVIIILAIVVGISIPAILTTIDIPAILTTIDNTKSKAFQTAADTAADWFDRQYQSSLVGDINISAVDTNYASFCSRVDKTSGTGPCGGPSSTIENPEPSSDANLIMAAGLKTGNVSSIAVYFRQGRACVTLTANATGDYAGHGTEGSNVVKGGNCQ